MVSLRNVEHDHAREEVSPEKYIVGNILVGVKQNNFLSVFASHIIGWNVDVRFWVFTKKSTGGLFLFTDNDVDEETFPDLFWSYKCHDVKVGVVGILIEELNHLIIELKFVGVAVRCKNVDDRVASLGSVGVCFYKERVFLKRLGGDGC